jgi:hypothetical protein
MQQHSFQLFSSPAALAGKDGIGCCTVPLVALMNMNKGMGRFIAQPDRHQTQLLIRLLGIYWVALSQQ